MDGILTRHQRKRYIEHIRICFKSDFYRTLIKSINKELANNTSNMCASQHITKLISGIQLVKLRTT